MSRRVLSGDIDAFIAPKRSRTFSTGCGARGLSTSTLTFLLGSAPSHRRATLCTRAYDCAIVCAKSLSSIFWALGVQRRLARRPLGIRFPVRSVRRRPLRARIGHETRRRVRLRIGAPSPGLVGDRKLPEGLTPGLGRVGESCLPERRSARSCPGTTTEPPGAATGVGPQTRGRGSSICRVDPPPPRIAVSLALNSAFAGLAR